MGGRCLGGAGFALRVSGPFSFTTSFFDSAAPAELQPLFHPWAGSNQCSVRPGGQGGYRTSSSYTRLLQPSLCDSQGHRWVAPGDRPLAPQRFCGCLPFSYGDYTDRSPVSPCWGLDGVPGFPGCLLLGSSSSIFPSFFQFRALSFGLSTAPQVFTRVMAPVSAAIMHRHGFRILQYLDGWLVFASTFQEIVRARDFLLWFVNISGSVSISPRACWIPGRPRIT